MRGGNIFETTYQPPTPLMAGVLLLLKRDSSVPCHAFFMSK